MLAEDSIVIVGAGAAGLMAAIWAGRTDSTRRIIVLDSASKIGRKILIAGGGRCNVTHHEVTEAAYAGASRNAIKKVLRQFDVKQTVDFFSDLNVPLKREDTGKLFPTTDSAKSVLDALVHELSRYGEIRSGHRVEQIVQLGETFVISGNFAEIRASNVILATGGKSIPKTGSDGHGYQLAKALGHTLTERIFPALVPLTIPRDHWFRDLKGITLGVTLELWSSTGKRLQSVKTSVSGSTSPGSMYARSMLFSHFGLTGPAVLDISRYLLDARGLDPDTQLTVNWLPEYSSESFSALLKQEKKRSVLQILRSLLPDRLARALLHEVFDDPNARREQLPANQLSKVERRQLTTAVTRFVAPIVGDRGFDYAEVTAGGVPLTELYLNTMASRICPRLYLCGEILNVDGATGYLAGRSV